MCLFAIAILVYQFADRHGQTIKPASSPVVCLEVCKCVCQCAYASTCVCVCVWECVCVCVLMKYTQCTPSIFPAQLSIYMWVQSFSVEFRIQNWMCCSSTCPKYLHKCHAMLMLIFFIYRSYSLYACCSMQCIISCTLGIEYCRLFSLKNLTHFSAHGVICFFSCYLSPVETKL